MKRLLVALMLFCAPAMAYERYVGEEQAVRTILGTASDEGYKEMYAVACAIRNRGGVLGRPEARASISNLPDPSVEATALKAWHDSYDGKDAVNGAKEWVNENRTGQYIRPSGWPDDHYMPPWAKKKNIRAKIGRHIFYAS